MKYITLTAYLLRFTGTNTSMNTTLRKAWLFDVTWNLSCLNPAIISFSLLKSLTGKLFLHESYWMEEGGYESAAQWTVVSRNNKTIHNKRVNMVGKFKSEVRIISEICVYLWIFPKVLPATALNLSGRISILAASWPGRCWSPARPPVLPERAFSRSLPLSALPAHSEAQLESDGLHRGVGLFTARNNSFSLLSLCEWFMLYMMLVQ